LGQKRKRGQTDIEFVETEEIAKPMGKILSQKGTAVIKSKSKPPAPDTKNEAKAERKTSARIQQ